MGSVPILHGPVTPQEEQEARDRVAKEAKERIERDFQERQVIAAEASNNLARKNFHLSLIVGSLTLLTLMATAYQGLMNKRSWQTAQATLDRMKLDSESSGEQFQVQLRHFDDGLGRTGLLAVNAGRQAEAAIKSASSAETSAASAKSVAATNATELTLSQRPWLSTSVIPTQPMQIVNHMALVFPEITMANLGHSVALNVHFRPIAIPEQFETGRECDIDPTSMAEYAVGGFSIFPGRSMHSATFAAPPFGMKQYPAGVNATTAPDDPSMDGIILITCIYYKSSFESKVHTTKDTFWVHRKPETKEVVSFEPREYNDFAD